MKRTVLLLFLLVIGNSYAQKKGRYRYTCAPPREVTQTNYQDSFPSVGPPQIRIVGPVVTPEWRGETLVVKPFGRFKIEGDGIITTYGFNTDNPTIYGRYKVKGDTLILTCRKSIQHFNKLAPKRRVKTKRDQVYRYIILEDGKLETSEYCFWYKPED